MITRVLVLTVSIVAMNAVYAQMSRKEVRKAQWRGDMANSGVGLSFYDAAFSDDKNPIGQWRGVNMLFGVFQLGIEQGYLHQNQASNLIQDQSRASSFYLGASIPLPFLTLGKYRSYNNSFRMHPIVNLNFNRLRSYDDEKIDVKIFGAHGALGYRLRLPFMSVDLTMNIHKGAWKSGSLSDYTFSKYTTYPMITIRWDGLMDKFSPTFQSVKATQTSTRVTGQTKSTSRERINGADYRVTRTTTSYEVKSTPTTVAILDIGRYKGIGPKMSTNGFRSIAFKDNTLMFGLQGLYRKGAVVLGGTIEAGKIGHGSQLDERQNKGSAEEGDNFYRKLDRRFAHGLGSYTAANAMVDFGFDFSSLKYGLLGIQVEDNDATPFTALAAGYSFGLNVILGQEFLNPAESNAFYDDLNAQNQLTHQRDNTYFEDPRNAQFGIMGGWFISCDIGHASLRMQWYKYRRAPLANGLLFSVAWRFN